MNAWDMKNWLYLNIKNKEVKSNGDYNASIIKISLQSAYQQTMKGVKINNYIDNRIMLSGRKLKNQVQTLIQSNQPTKPIVIRHLNYIEADEQQIQDHTINTSQKEMLKPIELKASKKKKKRTKTATANIIQFKTNETKSKLNLKEEAKVFASKQSSRKNVSAKKRSSSNSPGQQSIIRMNQTQRKLKSASKSVDGLGKRSKSAIIKRNKSPSHNNIHEFLKNTKDENSLKLDLSKRKDNNSKKKTTNKNKNSTANLQKLKTRQIKKNASNVHLNQKIKKFDKIITNSCKASRPAIKSYTTSTKNSKPVSARDRIKRDEKISGIAKNLFETIDHDNEHITLKNLLNLQKNDTKLKQALLKLEDALNSGSSRKKLSDKLELLAQKLKQIEDGECQKSEQISFPIQSATIQAPIKDNGIDSKIIGQKQAQCKKNILETMLPQNLNNKFTNQKIIKDLCESGSKKLQCHVQSQQMKSEDIKIEQKHNHKLDPEHIRLMLQHENGVYQTNNEYSNPLIGRKVAGDAYFDLADYDSINSIKSQNQENQKQQEINQLRKFQQQSDLMMKKIKKLQNKSKPQQSKQISSQVQEIQVGVKTNKQIMSEITKEKTQASPKNIEINNYAFEKYPSLQKVRSPKLNTQQINEVIKIKQKVLTDRHEKLSELVNLMYEKKLVSPKTYSLQVHSLRQQQQQNNEVLGNYRKHAEELAQLLSDIKKQKQEITNIDEMIRFQKWEQAKTVISSNDKAMPQISHSSQVAKMQGQNQKPKQEDSYQQAVYYEGQDSQISEPGFKLVQIEQEEEHQVGSNKQTNHIQIDEADHKVQSKQRGFDSNLFFIKEYCIALCEYVRDNYKDNFRQLIGKPMSYDLMKLLKSFRTNRDGSPAQIVNSLYEQLSYHDTGFHHNSPPISKEIFDEFNQKYEPIKYFGKEKSTNATLQGIFLSSIYDALNESISIEKPGSLNGEALPWAASSKHLKNMKNSVSNIENQGEKQQQSEDLIFGIAIARIIQWGSCLCGFIPDTVELQNTDIDEEYINHIRQTRTALLLEKMLIDEEAQMHRNQLQMTEVQLHLSDILFEDLLKQFLQDNRKIQFKKSLRQIDFNQ